MPERACGFESHGGHHQMYLRPANLSLYAPPPELLKVVDELLTSTEVLQQNEFELPKVIHPNSYRSFNSLLLHRDEIRDLKLVPVKDDVLHASYNAIRDDRKLVDDLLALIRGDEFVLAPNKYPYHLPPGVEQYILWLRTPLAPRIELVTFITQAMLFFQIEHDDIILFERPIGVKSKLVKGTFSAIRHVHVWIRS